MRFLATAYSDAGLVKKTNQDSCLIEIANTPYEEAALVAVADGMGGLKKGELASATVLRTLSAWFETKLPSSLEALDSSVEGLERFVEGQWHGLVQELNLKIMRYGFEHQYGLGTTLTAMLAFGARYTIVHVGDTRVYEITNEKVTQITTDQTFVNREIAAGRLTKEEGKTHPQRNVLLQCIGSSKEVNPDIIHGNLNPNASYLLCSDGFRHVLATDELRATLAPAVLQWQDKRKSSFPAKALKSLADTVKKRKESDNITAVLLQVDKEHL